MLLAEVVPDRREIASLHPKRLHQRPHDLGRLPVRFERNEEDPVLKVVERLRPELQRQPGLPGPAGSQQRQQPGIGGAKPGYRVRKRGLPPDEQRQLEGQVVGTPLK